MKDFSRLRRFLSTERLLGNAGVIVALAALFIGWALGMRFVRIALYVTSQHARIEVAELPIAVEAPVDGQVTFADVRLGRHVEAGDALVRLDARPLELDRAELAEAVINGTASLEALRDELDAEEGARDAAVGVATGSASVSKARVTLEEESLRFKEQESAVMGRLHDANAVSGLDALRSNAQAANQRALVGTSTAQAALDVRASQLTLRDRDARIAVIRHSMREAEAEAAKREAQIRTLDYEIRRRTTTAPTSGTIVDVLPISVGTTITSKDKLATILPSGPLRVVASFAPEESLGRLRPDQPARLRFDNFPWTDFGTVDAKVAAVGQEPRDGSVRVELEITRANPAIPLEHGMTAQCEVLVERVRPWDLVLRTAAHAIHDVPRAQAPLGAPLARAGATD